MALTETKVIFTSLLKASLLVYRMNNSLQNEHDKAVELFKDYQLFTIDNVIGQRSGGSFLSEPMCLVCWEPYITKDPNDQICKLFSGDISNQSFDQQTGWYTIHWQHSWIKRSSLSSPYDRLPSHLISYHND